MPKHIDHHARATRLREFMDSLSKVNEEYLRDEEDIDLDGEIPHVPHRYAVSEWDGSSTNINFADTLEDAAAIAGDLGGGDYPWAPGAMVDLDTGMPYEPVVSVRFVPLRWVVKASFAFSNSVSDVRFLTRKLARDYIREVAPNDSVTVLEGPIDTLAEAG